MGWCAIDFCNDVWSLFKKYVPKKQQKRVAKKLIEMFEEYDMDDMCGDSEVEIDADIKYKDG
ncbi:MAG: hypothetical protein PVG30_01890 [Gammaproteobacteria bacterium]|jgi:hypothetical protein